MFFVSFLDEISSVKVIVRDIQKEMKGLRTALVCSQDLEGHQVASTIIDNLPIDNFESYKTFCDDLNIGGNRNLVVRFFNFNLLSNVYFGLFR